MSRRHTSPAPVPAPPLEDENLLQEIFLCLPPKPSSIPRASLVCKLWCSSISDPQFLKRFRKHHRKPPLLGFFGVEYGRPPVFTPLLDRPDRIPVALPENLLFEHPSISFLGCRHGITLILDYKCREAILWDPLTDVQNSVAFPPMFRNVKDYYIRSAAVFCPDVDNQHMHGDCHMSPFKLVFACHDPKHTKASVCIYESMSGLWGDIISTATIDVISWYRPSILVGNALCWLLNGGDIFEFDFEKQALVVIEKPAETRAAACDYGTSSHSSFQILRAEDNGIGLAVLSMTELSIQLWVRKSNYDGVLSWVLQNTVQLDELFSRPAHVRELVFMLGYDEDTNVIFLSSDAHDFILKLETMQFNYIGRREYRSPRITYPYTNFCTTVRSTVGGDGGAQNVNT